MTQPSWKRRPLPWAGSDDSGGTVVVPPPPTSPPPSGPPPSGGPPAPPATAAPVVTVGQQTNRVRSDIAIGTTTSALVATNNPTAWYLIIGEPTYWKLRTDGRFESVRTLDPTRTDYTFFVVATNSAGASATTLVNIPVEIIATPTPSAPPPVGGGGGTTNGVPNDLLNLAPAPVPVYPGDSTSGTSTQETYPYPGEWASVVRRGPVIGENNTWDIGPGKWNKTFVADPDAAINSSQFHQSVWVGAATSADAVSFRLRYKWPTGQSKPSGADSEVTSYPSVGRGALLGWSHRQLRRPANVPKRFKDHASLWVSSKSISASVSCKGHLSDDMRATNSDAETDTYPGAVAQITAEFMIVHRTYEGYGLGPGARPSGSHRGTLTIGGIEWYIHTQGGATFFPDGSRAMLLAFIPTSGILPIHVNYAPVLEFCCTRRYRDMPNGPGSYFERGRGPDDFLISPDSFLAQGFFGYEPDGTDGGEVDIQVSTHVWAVNLYTGGGVSQPVPVITAGQVFSVKEDAAVGTVIGTLAASNSPTGYSIVSGGSGKFAIGSDGRITVASALDYETMQSATLTFRATNAAGASANVTGVVNIGNVAEVAPSITSGQSFTVAENVTPGTVFATVAATPGDAPIFGFQIVSGNTGNTIGINAAGGLFVAAPMTDGSLTLGIKAYSGSLESSVTSVGLTITNVGAPPAPPPSAWPVAQTVTGPTVSVDMSVPAYLTPVTDARWSQTKLTRISDVATFDAAVAGTWNNFGPAYAARQCSNCDDTRTLIWTLGVQSNGNYDGAVYGVNWHLINATTKAYIGKVAPGGRALPNNWRWSRTDPNEILFVDFGPNTLLEKLDISTGTYSTLKDFSANGYNEISNDFSGGVGDPSIDGRYWALSGRKGSQWYVFCWDRQTNTITCEIPVPMEPGGGSGLVAVDMLRSGAGLIIVSTTDWTSGATPVGQGISYWSRAGVLQAAYDIRSPVGGPYVVSVTAHHSLALDSFGNDVYVFFRSADGINREIVSLRLSDGLTRAEAPVGAIHGKYYIGAYAFGRPDWVIVSDHPTTLANGTFNANPMTGHIWAIRLNGSKQIYPIAQARITMVDFTTIDWYYWIPWATPNNFLTQVLFKSAMNTDWSTAGGGNPTLFHAYIAEAA